MRLALFILCVSACSTDPVEPSEPTPASVRERLATSAMTRLLLSADDSAGTVTVKRKISGGWDTGAADLVIDYGEVAASATTAGEITIEKLSIAMKPIEIPASVFNREASLSHARAELARPAAVTTTWLDDNTAHITATLDLAFSWSLTVDGNTSGLGAPDLPPLAITLDVTGDGSVVHADIHAGAAGDLWSWAGLLKLSDLSLVLAADTP